MLNIWIALARNRTNRIFNRRRTVAANGNDTGFHLLRHASVRNDLAAITRAGTPATIVAGGTSERTTAQAPTTAPRPIRTPGPTNERAAIQDSCSIVIGDADRENEMSR